MQFTQQRQNVAAGDAAEDAIFVLQDDQVYAVEVDEVRRAPVGLDIALLQLEAHHRRVGVALFSIVDRDGEDARLRRFRCERLTKVGRKRRNATLPRKIVADDRDLLASLLRLL